MTVHDSYVLGVDVGTSSLKAAAFDYQGRVRCVTKVGYDYQTPQPGWAEIDSEVWWGALKAALGDLKGQHVDLSQIAALAFSGQMHSAVLLDEKDVPVYPCILWLDRRAAAETEELREKFQLPAYQLNSTFTFPKLVWLNRHCSEVVKKAKKIMWPKDYLRWKITGRRYTDFSDALGSGLTDWENRSWNLQKVDLTGLAADVLPPILDAREDGGKVLAERAEELGLNPEAKVIVGMGDMAALVGGAPPKVGRVVSSLGSSSMTFGEIPKNQAVSAPHDALYTVDVASFHLFGGISSTSGASLVWLYEKIFRGPERGISFGAFTENALEAEPGCGGLVFVPYLAGERSPYWSDSIQGGFYGLQVSHDIRHLTRAVMEGIAYSLRHLLDIFDESGVPVSELALAAGGTRTAGLVQTIADVCQRDILIFTGQETVTRVLFALCMESLGRQKFEEVLVASFDHPEIVSCQTGVKETYDKGYRVYREFSRFAAEQAVKY